MPNDPLSIELPTRACLDLPPWVLEGVAKAPVVQMTERMHLCIDLADRARQRGGGPFGALVYDRAARRLVSACVNLVLQGGSSLFHAEVGALLLAQQRLQTHTLSGGDFELVTSSEPCAQCLGAICWAGVRSLVCGASVADAESIGFDEGPLRDDWVEELERRGVRVTRGVLADEACAVLRAYAAADGPIYNGSPVAG